MLHKIDVVREKKDLAFIMANGQRITRSVGFAIIRIEEYFTIDEVVFGEEGDMVLLGARTLEGLNFDRRFPFKTLVASGAFPWGLWGESLFSPPKNQKISFGKGCY